MLVSCWRAVDNLVSAGIRESYEAGLAHSPGESIHTDTRVVPSYSQASPKLWINRAPSAQKTPGLARCARPLLRTLNDRSKFCDLVKNRATLGNQLRDLLARVHHRGVVSSSEQLPNLRQ